MQITLHVSEFCDLVVCNVFSEYIPRELTGWNGEEPPSSNSFQIKFWRVAVSLKIYILTIFNIYIYINFPCSLLWGPYLSLSLTSSTSPICCSSPCCCFPFCCSAHPVCVARCFYSRCALSPFASHVSVFCVAQFCLRAARFLLLHCLFPPFASCVFTFRIARCYLSRLVLC